jgi:AraC-like DNA-binding protein
LAAVFQRLFDARITHAARFDAPQVFCGYETRTATDYYFDGTKRADPAHPIFVFQCTLDGWGCYAEQAVTRVEPGMAFTAVCPSPHRYYFPAESRAWTFFWFVVHHPYVVSRISRVVKRCGAVLRVAPKSVLMSSALRLFQGICENAFADGLAEEQLLFEFMLAYERHAGQLLYPQPVRERTLEETRAYVLQHLGRPIGTAELARVRNMSRSHFGHHFKATTGLSPAHFVTQVRLQEASRRLLACDEKISAIARQTGFADANHLCKVFRRHYHLSPGEFRRQIQEGQTRLSPVLHPPAPKNICESI